MLSLFHTLAPKRVALSLSAFMLKYELHIFLAILVLGVYLRTTNLLNTTTWFGDSGRDILVAKHMALYRDNLMVAPGANGGFGVLINTPFYFWILACMWLFTGSEQGVILLFSLIGVSNIVIAYVVAKQFGRGFSALLLPFFVTVSSFFVYAARNVWQPHLLPFFQLLSMLFLIRGLKNHTKYLYLSIQMAFFATHIHLSYTPLLLITIAVTAYALYRKRHYMNLAYMCILIISNVIAWLLLLPRLSTQVQSLITGKIFPTFFHFTYENLTLLSGSIFTKSNSTLSSIIILVLPIYVMYISLRLPNIKRAYSLIIGTMLSSILALGGYAQPLHFHYLIPYYVLELIAFAFVLTHINTHKYSYLIILTLVALITMNISRGNRATLMQRPTSEIQTNQQIAKAILQINTSSSIILSVCISNNMLCLKNDGFTSSVWFYLEKYSGEKLGVIANTNNGNFIPTRDDTKRADRFIVCMYPTHECLEKMEVLPTEADLLYSDGREITLYHVGQPTIDEN